MPQSGWFLRYELEVERAAGIEPAWLAWKARALPLSNARLAAYDRNPIINRREVGWEVGRQLIMQRPHV